MIAPSTLEPVRTFLHSSSGQSFLVSEVVVSLRTAGLTEVDVVAALRELERRGEAVWRSFPMRDPHLAYDSLEFVAGVDFSGTEDARHQAELATQRGFRNWLQAWLSGHRCS
jgi:hypothetical protein